MRWRDFAKELDARPEFREAFAEQFPYANVALAVVALRARHDLTQRALAERVGTPQPVIARLESGRHPVEIKLLSRIATAVGESWTVAFDSNGAAVDIDPPTSGDALLDAFNEANTASDFETASMVASQIARDPSTPRRRLALALDAYNRGDHAGAERWGREAVADTGLPEPSREVALLVVGRSVLNLDRPKEALRVLRPLRKPKYIGWLRDAALAEAHLEADQPDAAQAAVDRVLGAVDVPEAHYLAARILWHRDQLWSALEQVMLYRASQPDDPSGLLLQGSILGFLGDAKSYPGAHEAALELFARALTTGGCEAVRLHGVTAARIGRWKEAMEDARRLRDHSDGHDIDHHRDAVEAIVSDVFSNLPDDADWGPPTSVAEELLGTEHEMVRLQRALVAGLSGDVGTAAEILGLDPAAVGSAPVPHQLAIAAGLLADGRTVEAATILARNIDDLSVPDGLIRLAGTALAVDDVPIARSALERLAEAAGSTGEVAAIANRLLQALVQANEPASISGTAVGGFTWSDVARRYDPLSAVDSTWEGPHTPSSAVMDRMTRAFLH